MGGVMVQLPRDKSLDSTLALALEGYTFGAKRRRRYQSDIFETRLRLQKVIFMSGAEAARIFYDTERFQREGVAPTRVQKTLFGTGGVQGMDGDAHRWRKQMFMAMMTPGRIQQLADLTAEQWRAYIGKWETMDRVVLFDEAQEILCRAICTWAGVPLQETEVKQRTADIAAMIAGTGAVGPRHWQARAARRRTEQWIRDIISKVRTHKLTVDAGSVLYIVACHRDLKGKLLDKQVAAVELLNVLRPTVAVARFVIFAALALHEHPEYRQKLQTGDDNDLELFVQEVRRFYPFFPFVIARVRRAFEWKGYRFPKGRKVILDLYGTNHDTRLWEQPEEFRPERFRQWSGSAYDFIPQGGGDHYKHHRCPGEWITIELMKVAVRLLCQSMHYDVPRQNLRISLSRMPAMPKSRFVIHNVRPIRQYAMASVR